MIVNILLLVGIISTSFVLGFNVGIKRGVKTSMEIAIKGTIMTLAEEFDKLGMKDTFKTIVDKTFDGIKLDL
jgi:hypothetical protein